MSTTDDLPLSEYAFPGPLRDLLVGAILAGEKTTTTFLLRELEIDDESMPAVGDRAVIDSESLTAVVREHRVGDSVDVTYLRDGAEQKAEVTFTEDTQS